jgi:hypothetical protein
MNGHQHDDPLNLNQLPPVPKPGASIAEHYNAMEAQLESAHAELNGFRVFLSILAERNGGELVFNDQELQDIGNRVEELSFTRDEADKCFRIKAKVKT